MFFDDIHHIQSFRIIYKMTSIIFKVIFGIQKIYEHFLKLVLSMTYPGFFIIELMVYCILHMILSIHLYKIYNTISMMYAILSIFNETHKNICLKWFIIV